MNVPCSTDGQQIIPRLDYLKAPKNHTTTFVPRDAIIREVRQIVIPELEQVFDWQDELNYVTRHFSRISRTRK